MKITDTGLIQNSEKELIDAITGDLNWDVIEQLFKEKYNLGLQDDVEYKKGDIVVYNDQIAYKLDFEVKVTLSVLFDRKGECLEVAALDAGSELSGLEEVSPVLSDSPVPGNAAEDTLTDSAGENVSRMASQIADMITDINKE